MNAKEDSLEIDLLHQTDTIIEFKWTHTGDTCKVKRDAETIYTGTGNSFQDTGLEPGNFTHTQSNGSMLLEPPKNGLKCGLLPKIALRTATTSSSGPQLPPLFPKQKFHWPGALSKGFRNSKFIGMGN
ncbi:hypothetical protein [Planococcus koreensis]|uniref:hypothetical protein n=1 Tax=Planococcus koreensis TaxID=112331 RepID=UPI0039FC4F42